MSSKLKRVTSLWLAALLLLPLGWLAPAAKAADASSTTVYHETFADSTGVAQSSGNAVLSQVADKNFEGNDDGGALYVSSRTASYSAADFNYSDIGLADGQTYTVTVTVYVDPGETIPEGAQAYLQTADQSFGWLAGAAYKAGEPITLSGELTVGANEDTKIRVQSNDAGANVPFYIGDILIKGQPTVVYHETFADNTGVAQSSGNAVLSQVADKNFEGNDDGGALYVSSRTASYSAADFNYSDIGLADGQTYTVTVTVYVDPGETIPEGAQAYLQTADQSFGWLAGAAYKAGEPITLSGELTVGANEDTKIRVQSNDAGANVPFYIGDILIEGQQAPPDLPVQDLTPIQDVYADDFLIGSAVAEQDLADKRLELLTKHFNVATAENAMKPESLQPTKGNFTFDAADAIVNKVLDAGMQMHGHVLVWHSQTPAWMYTGSKEEVLANMQDHITTVMEHFGDKVISWDVVNEAMNDNPSNPSDWKASLRQSPWYTALGPDYVEQAFLTARAVLDAHPEWKDIKLYYNDYNEDNPNKAQAIYNMVKELNDNYAADHNGKKLIDGIGMQAHYSVNTSPDNVKASLEKFISLGVKVSISELDIGAGSGNKLSDKQAIEQGYLYAQLFNIYKAHAKDIERVTFWGMNDAASWRSDTSPLLFDNSLQAKPAYYGVIDPDTFIDEHPPEVKITKQTTASYGTPEAIDGKADAVWSKAPDIPVNQYQLTGHGATGVAKALWDEHNLYVLFQVSDQQLDDTSNNDYEQDSIEVFLDQNNAKTTSYQSDDGQYRVNYNNKTSFNPTSIAAGFESAVEVSGTNYTVEVKIPLTAITPKNGTVVGFDAQINDAKDGSRQSVASWNDLTGTGYANPSVFGELKLNGKSDTTGGNNNTPQPETGSVEINSGTVTIHPVLKTSGNVVTGVVTDDLLDKALKQATAGADGRKQVTINLPKQTGASSYEAQLPAQRLDSGDNLSLLLQTEFGTIELPSRMLSNVTNRGDQVSVRVSQVSASDLDVDAAARSAIGSRPVVELSLLSGGRTIAWNNPEAPVTVSIPYTPTADELAQPDSIVVWYIDGNGQITSVPNGRYDAATKTVTFQTTHFSAYAVAVSSKSFTDLSSVPWAQSAIEAMAARDIIKGVSASSFSPGASIKRADFIALLVRALELKGSGQSVSMFSDVHDTDYYYEELAIAKELGIAAGYEDNTFKPNSTISRQDMMVLTARALEAAGKPLAAGGTLAAYPDAAQVAGYAEESAAALVQAGIVNGKGSIIAPADSLTRAEAAVILYRIWSL
ncbi:endo-1,4-beta-xylanase [Paenibacillus protaetiae]|uniref:Beta-xylanase n=1 Tax=Paenibacillus protaetiae TaxID=2509456 RepID=A0A4P6EVE7_9BACL|nr:endo-1,4-beta-xylanase [Paenibacillus protaetiae]QAY67270.1 1,4-beta-xylanase [Paenibacillus protaetiae]